MIVSHQHRFIFIKSAKTAGTSLEVALGRICGADDVITPLTPNNSRFDSDTYQHKPRNNEGFTNHMPADEIHKRVGEEVWNSYLKITVVRNPWDLVVSRYYWEKAQLWYNLKRNLKNILREPFNLIRYRRLMNRLRLMLSLTSFSTFILFYRKDWTNSRFYFDGDGKPCCDIYIRYEQLDEGIMMLEKRLGVELGELPHLKDKTRKYRNHYSQHYCSWQIRRIGNLFRQEIEFFGYTFGEPQAKSNEAFHSKA